MIIPIKKISKNQTRSCTDNGGVCPCFSIHLLITYGLIEFGRMVFIYAAVTGSAREGARYGAAAGNFNTRYYMDCAGILNAVQRGAILTPIILRIFPFGTIMARIQIILKILAPQRMPTGWTRSIWGIELGSTRLHIIHL